LTFHLDECWFVHFSPSGEYLASIGLDQSIILWRDLMVTYYTFFLFFLTRYPSSFCFCSFCLFYIQY
jgi:WD40 repeat protein